MLTSFLYKWVFLLSLLAFFQPIMAQEEGDTLWFTEKEPRIPTHFQFFHFGAAFSDGNLQYFDGYNHKVLYSDAQAGLPLYNDWHVYSSYSILPKYYFLCAYGGAVDTVKNLRLRFGGGFWQKTDSFYYTGSFAVLDTIYGRTATEHTNYFSGFLSAMKTTRKLFHVLRLYAGVDLEVAAAFSSDIHFAEFKYDFGEEKIIDENHFTAKGRARMSLFGNALIGAEIILAKRVGLHFEIRSGVGVHWVPNDASYGLSRNAYHAGLNFYLFPY